MKIFYCFGTPNYMVTVKVFVVFIGRLTFGKLILFLFQLKIQSIALEMHLSFIHGVGRLFPYLMDIVVHTGLGKDTVLLHLWRCNHYL